eukprot:scaffold552_cov526-Prasinococcus_capsulatus_cf.AAC.12
MRRPTLLRHVAACGARHLAHKGRPVVDALSLVCRLYAGAATGARQLESAPSQRHGSRPSRRAPIRRPAADQSGPTESQGWERTHVAREGRGRPQRVGPDDGHGSPSTRAGPTCPDL